VLAADTVVLIGDGAITLLFLQLLTGQEPLAALAAEPGHTRSGPEATAEAHGGSARPPPRVMVAGKHAARLAAAQALGADAVVDVNAEPIDGAVREWTGGVGADLVIECVGRPEVWETALALAAPGGEVLLYGGCAAGTRVVFDPYRIHYEEVDVKGAFHYDPVDVRRAFTLLQSGAIDVDRLVTHRVPLGRVGEAIELALSREAIKVAIQP
jgi:L-iditol 2-dehydrogenase